MEEKQNSDTYSEEYANFTSSVIKKLFDNGFTVDKIFFEDFKIKNSKKNGKKVVAQVTTTLTIEI